MKLRYDFGKNLNLSDFRSRFSNNLGKEVLYSIFLHDFRVDINPSVNKEFIYVNVFDISRDTEENITISQIIYPPSDKRLESIDLVKRLFTNNGSYYCVLDLSTSKSEIVKDICDLISVLHKVSKLKVFL